MVMERSWLNNITSIYTPKSYTFVDDIKHYTECQNNDKGLIAFLLLATAAPFAVP